MNAASIFIVEDEIITAKSIAKNLKSLGYKVAGIATTGAKAIAQVTSLKPDLILMDILLKKSDLDGISTAARIQSQINIPVVYLTAHSDAETLERAKVTTPFGYILKPFRAEELQAAIEIALYKHRQELELIEREQLFSSILNSTQEGVIATDRTSQVTFMNPAAQKLTGWNTTEAIAHQVGEVIQIIDARTNQSIPDPIQQAIEQGEVVYLNEHTVLIAKDGSKIPITDSASPIFRQTQEVQGAVLIFTPSHESLSSANILNQETDRLTASYRSLSRVSDSVIETRLNKFSSDLLEFIVHELRTPLTIVLSTSESLRHYRQRWTPERQSQSFDTIKQAIEQMTQLLNNVTVWEQADANKLSPQLESIDLVSICQELLSNLRTLDNDRHRIIFAALVDEARAYLDPTLLQYALNNLCSNAIKYSPRNSTIYLTLNRQEGCFVLQISDRGRGIPLPEQPFLFDSFYRGSNVEDIPGTGLGLAIAKTCIEIQQGKISFESEEGEGTTFTITLPAPAEI